MFKEHGLCPMLSLTLFKIFSSKYIWVTTLTPQSQATTSVTWPIDSPYVISYLCLIGTEPLQPFSRYSTSKSRVHTQTDTRRKWFYILSHAMYCIGQTVTWLSNGEMRSPSTIHSTFTTE